MIIVRNTPQIRISNYLGPYAPIVWYLHRSIIAALIDDLKGPHSSIKPPKILVCCRSQKINEPQSQVPNPMPGLPEQSKTGLSITDTEP